MCLAAAEQALFSRRCRTFPRTWPNDGWRILPPADLQTARILGGHRAAHRRAGPADAGAGPRRRRHRLRADRCRSRPGDPGPVRLRGRRGAEHVAGPRPGADRDGRARPRRARRLRHRRRSHRSGRSRGPDRRRVQRAVRPAHPAGRHPRVARSTPVPAGAQAGDGRGKRQGGQAAAGAPVPDDVHHRLPASADQRSDLRAGAGRALVPERDRPRPHLRLQARRGEPAPCGPGPRRLAGKRRGGGRLPHPEPGGAALPRRVREAQDPRRHRRPGAPGDAGHRPLRRGQVRPRAEPPAGPKGAGGARRLRDRPAARRRRAERPAELSPPRPHLGGAGRLIAHRVGITAPLRAARASVTAPLVGEPSTVRLPGSAAEQAPASRVELLQSITEAADEAPTVEDALRAALSRICAHTGWQAGRLQFCADAGDLAHRTFWHLMDPERLPSYRALAQARRDAPDVALMARVLAHGSPLWTPVPQGTENGHAATGTRATVAFPVFVGTNLFALLEFFSGVEERPEPATVDAVSLACAELGRILQRKPADDELRRSEREYRALFENARDAILMVDPRAEVVVDANYHACELYGFPRAELVGATVARLWRDPDADRARLREAELGMGGAYESRHARKDGSMIVVEVTAGPVEYRGRRALWTSIRDVSDRIRVLEALRTSEERYRLLFDASPQAMWVFDAETLRFLAVNDAAVKRYGYSRDEFLRMTILDIRPPEDVPALNDRLERLAEGGATSANIWRHRKANGELMDVEVTSHAIELSGRRARLVVSIDVTERLRAEEKLWHAAFYDVLTGLPNRALFMERLGMALERAKGRGARRLRGAVPRPGPVQGGERLAGAPRRRPAAHPDLAAAGADQARGGHGGPAGRGRVRRPGGGRGDRRRRGPGGGAGAARAVDALRHRRPGGLHLHLDRHRAGRRAPLGAARGHAARRRYGDVPGQGHGHRQARGVRRHHARPRGGGAAAGERPAARHRARRAARAVPADRGAGQRAHRRLRGAGALAAPPARDRGAVRVHSPGGGDGRDRRAGPVGDAGGVHADAAPAGQFPPGEGADLVREHLRAAGAAARPGGADRRHPAGDRAGRPLLAAGDHRERPGGERRRRDPLPDPAPPAGPAAVHRRLRHRVQLAQLPAPAAHRPPQDRLELRADHGLGREEPPHRGDDPPPGAQPGRGGGGRRRGDGRPGDRPAPARLRLRAGVPLLAAARHRRGRRAGLEQRVRPPASPAGLSEREGSLPHRRWLTCVEARPRVRVLPFRRAS